LSPTPFIDDRRRALSLVPVSRETEERFAVYADLLTRWQRIKNLVAPNTLSEVWTRHLADSAQVVSLMPDALRWADIGSGAGFPGLVVAIMLAGRQGAHVDLVEANSRKCAFLREVARACGAPATVHNDRIEAVLPALKSVDVLTARALAPLPDLLEMGKILIDGGATAIFLKSRGEISDDGDCGPSYVTRVIPSVTSNDGRILMLRRADITTGTQP
jgi:16S rRNA (guanine527-N7)-methyltransferase